MQTPKIDFDREMLSNFEDAIQKEWLITNGLGGYASSTILGINTRKYHGLLVSAVHPPGDRRVCLAKMDEEISIGNDTYSLGANEFQSGIFPKGYLYLEEFSVSPFPRYTYSVQKVEVRKNLFMPQGKNVVVALYRILNNNASEVQVRVYPYLNWRHFHYVTDRWRSSFESSQADDEKRITIRFRPPETVIMMKATAGSFRSDKKWVEKTYLREESLRGETCFDDCYVPGHFDISVRAGRSETFAITAVADEKEDNAKVILDGMPSAIQDFDDLYEEETKKREEPAQNFYNEHSQVGESDWLSWLILTTEGFMAKDLSDHQYLIAGYHWFETWGRDTFVSLPGLMLTPGRFEEARNVLLNYERYCKNGLIPNYIPDREGEPTYNTVDASLWFINAVLQYLKHTGDTHFVEGQLWRTLKQIIEAYTKGTIFDIHMDYDSLLAHGPQLTWMDVAIEGKPITPRDGKAVEIQALWYNALKTISLLAGRFNEQGEADRYEQIAEKAKKSFVDKFWNGNRNCLFDCIKGEEKDVSLRPNQIVAVSLDFTMFDGVKSEKIVDSVHQELLAPFGLRTLARDDSRYVGIYAGDRDSRDRAYHNGTVWPWLLGPFVTAFLKTKGYTEFRRDLASNFLMPLLSRQVYEAGLGSLSEIYDGESPHKPRGCISQAWSVAEPLRAYIEDVAGVRPKNETEF
jgi:predicted glycogen debranching enzyme